MHVGEETRAVVTGASRGIGRALARELDSRGVRLGLVAREKSGLEALGSELSGDPILAAADVSDRAAIEEAVTRFARIAGGIDLLVANAGLAHYGPFADMPVELAEEMVSVNVLGTVLTVHAALGPMIDAGRGHIVIVSSGAGIRAFPSGAVYGATKAAGAGLGEALRHELSGTGVSVTTVFPGEVETDLHAHQPDRLPDWRRGDEAVSPELVARGILAAVEKDEPTLYIPAAVRLLGLNGIAPRATDKLLRRLRGPSAAPRRD